MAKTILCNTNAQVMGNIPWQEAVTKIILGKAISIKDSDHIISSPSFEIFRPEIVMLTNYGDDSARYQKWSSTDVAHKRVIHIRDNWICAYCGEFGDTIDHIVPKVLGGGDKWDNVITACKRCNNLKDDKLLTELGWEMLYDPTPVSWNTQLRYEQSVVDDFLKSLVAP